jgi:DNA-binding transcriptional ArsR family regulator
MMMFESTRGKILKFLEGKEKATLEEIALEADKGKTKTNATLYGLKAKKLVEKLEDGSWRLMPKVELKEEPKEEGVINLDEVPLPKKEGDKLGLSDQIQEINEKLNIIAGIKKKEPKRFKLKGFSDKKLRRLNKGKKRAIFMLRQNGAVELLKGEYMQGMVKVGENYYDASAMYVWQFKRMNKYTPFYIIPEWSIRPLAREEVYSKAVTEKTLIDSQIITLRAVKMEQVGKPQGQKMGGMMWIGLIIGGLIIAWIIFGGKK